MPGWSGALFPQGLVALGGIFSGPSGTFSQSAHKGCVEL